MKMNIWFDIVCDKFIIVEIEIVICISRKNSMYIDDQEKW